MMFLHFLGHVKNINVMNNDTKIYRRAVEWGRSINTRHGNVCHADDVVSAAMEACWKAIGLYDANINNNRDVFVYKFVNTAVLNLYKNEVRRKTKFPSECLYKVNKDGDEYFNDRLKQLQEQSSEDNFIEEDYARHIHRAIDKLPEREREVLHQYYGLTTGKSSKLREIAQKLNLTPAAVSYLKNNALSKLKQKINQ